MSLAQFMPGWQNFQRC